VAVVRVLAAPLIVLLSTGIPSNNPPQALAPVSRSTTALNPPSSFAMHECRPNDTIVVVTTYKEYSMKTKYPHETKEYHIKEMEEYLWFADMTFNSAGNIDQSQAKKIKEYWEINENA
jgi:hypothetical protein